MPEPILGALEEAFRRIVREEVTAALAAAGYTHAPTPAPATDAPSTPVESASGWVDVNEFPLRSGSKTYTVAVGNPVKVKGWGRSGGNADGYTVTRIQQRGDDVNVEVRKGRDHARTVKADKIVYKRPKKGPA